MNSLTFCKFSKSTFTYSDSSDAFMYSNVFFGKWQAIPLHFAYVWHLYFQNINVFLDYQKSD